MWILVLDVKVTESLGNVRIQRDCFGGRSGCRGAIGVREESQSPSAVWD